MNERKKSRRGRILTDEGFEKLKNAVNKKFLLDSIEATAIELTEMLSLVIQNKGEFSLNTLKKIWKREENTDIKFIKVIAETFGLKFEDGIDYTYKDDTDNTTEQKTSSSPATAKIDTDIEDYNLQWVGRCDLISELRQNLLGELRIISIVGITGIGKTSLAMQLSVDEHISNYLTSSWVNFYDAPTKTFDVVARQVLGEKLAAQPQLKQDREVLLLTMINELQVRPTLLIMDMLEGVLMPEDNGGYRWKEEESIFADFLGRIILAENMPSRIILTSQYSLPVLIQSRYDDVRLLQVTLKGLTQEESLGLFESWKVNIENNQIKNFLIRIINIYDGHPLALRLIAGDIINEPYDGDFEAFWEDNKLYFEAIESQNINGENFEGKDIIDRVGSRVEETLKRLSVSHIFAYLMLCMGGELECFVEKNAWLLLLCNLPKEEQNLAFETLNKRFLLERKNFQNKVFYRLHSLIKNVANEYDLDTFEKD